MENKLQNNQEAKLGDQNNSVVLHQQSYFSGPLPHPEILKKYNEIAPGTAERIIKMAEGQFLHRTELEKKVINSDISRSKWGQILGFIIAIFGLSVAGFVSVYGNAWAGGIIGVGTLATLVGVFMYGSKIRSKEREEKALVGQEAEIEK